MNIHEHQAKQILKKYGAIVPQGVFALSVDELVEKAKSLNTKKYVLKAQIHAGGRGKAGGVKILDTIEELSEAAKELMGKTLITHQTGPEGREVKRLYVEESSTIEKEFYLSCLVDRASSKIAFISSDQGGMDIEEVAKNTPEKIITTKVDLNNEILEKDCEKIVKIFNLNDQTIIELNLGFDRAWSAVSRALDAGKITSNDIDRDNGLFFVSYAVETEEAGWFSFLNFKNDEKNN